MTSTEPIFSKTQRGHRKLVTADGHAYNLNRTSSDQKVEYYRCQSKLCHGRVIYYKTTQEAKITTEHDEDVEHHDPTRRAKDAAIQKLRELTLSSDESTSPIEIIRKVFKNLTPEVCLLMPSEPALVRRVQRWAKANNIQLGKANPLDYVLSEGKEPLVDTADASKNNSVPTTSTLALSSQVESGSDFSKRYSELLSRKRNPKAWRVQSLKRVDDDGNEIGTASLEDFLLGPCISGSQDGLNTSNLSTPSAKRPVPAIENADEYGVGDDDMMDYGDDNFQMDFDTEPQPQESQTINVKVPLTTNPFNSSSSVRKTTNSPVDAVKSGERCFICGDELIVSETLGASEETFRTACRYLNVTSKGEWFPKAKNAKFYSFCESCTNEINKIHSLYRKIEEIQSLIFKKVECVEKRIADAEIVDNWMAEAPHSTAVRFEGFRKQVMINYRNKLKLRREIRFGKKTGKAFVEVLPGSSAHMYACDPGLDSIPVNKSVRVGDGTFATAKKLPTTRSKPKPKSKKPPEEREETNIENATDFDMMLDNATAYDDDGFQNDLDDSQDSMSVASEKEVKFWQNDPSKLEISQQQQRNTTQRRSKRNTYVNDKNDYSVNDSGEGEIDDDENYEGGNNSVDEANDSSDPDYNEGANRASKSKKMKSSNAEKNAVVSKPPNIIKRRTGRPSKHPQDEMDTAKTGKFPDAVLTKDGRVFMEGIEIIKNPLGACKTHPYSVSFTCGVCGKIVLNFWNIRLHICGHHLGMYKCHICQRELSEPKVLAAHIERHGERQYEECSICGKPITKHKTNMQLHQWSHLSKEEQEDPKYKSWRPTRFKDPSTFRPTQTFMCGQCGKTFKIPSMLRRHELKHTDGQTVLLICQYCGRTYNDRKALSSHTSRCKNNANGRSGGSNSTTLPCPKCDKRFSSRETRSRHIRRIHCKLPMPELLFSCPKCPRKFSTRGGFRAHKRVCIDGLKGYNVPSKSTDSDRPSTSSSSVNFLGYYPDLKPDPNDTSSSFTQRDHHDLEPVRQGNLPNTTGASAALGFNYTFM